MRGLLVFLIAVFFFLQYELWFSNGGIVSALKHRHALALQQQKIDQAQEKNHQLASNIHDLKNGKQAVEGEARRELGMIKKGEVFYQVVKNTVSNDGRKK